MNKLLLTLVVLLSCNTPQKKTKLYNIDYSVYDSLGNVTYYRKTFDHEPTEKDTIEYRKELTLILSGKN